MMRDDKGSFWTTLPGILMGIAALITAIVTLYTVFYAPSHGVSTIGQTPTPTTPTITPTPPTQTIIASVIVPTPIPTPTPTETPTPTQAPTSAPTAAPTVNQVPTNGTINVWSSPDGAKVLIGGVEKGTTTSDTYTTLTLPAGTYTVQIIKPGYKEYDQQVVLAAGDSKVITAYLEAIVTSTPTLTPTPTPTPTAVMTVAAVNAVDITSSGYNPAIVSVPNGTTVTWTNKDNVTHTVTSTTGEFDSGLINPGQTFSRTFSVARSYDYGDTSNSSMSGTVVVT